MLDQRTALVDRGALSRRIFLKICAGSALAAGMTTVWGVAARANPIHPHHSGWRIH